jgi:hypothetical protein
MGDIVATKNDANKLYFKDFTEIRKKKELSWNREWK